MKQGHNLFLGMYAFSLKKQNTSNSNPVDNNDFLSISYPSVSNKFIEGFYQEIISLIDQKTFKNEQNTHGAVLESKDFNSANRTIDLMINGGITGIKQLLIDEEGNQEELPKVKTIGLKFFARIWLPANSHTGYIFIQKYGSLSIKPIFDSIIKKITLSHGFALIGSRIVPTTTKKRQKEFFEKSSIRDLVIISSKSSHETGTADAVSATIKLRNFHLKGKSIIEKEDLKSALKNHGFSIGDRDYYIKATYTNSQGMHNEEKTVVLDDSEETINIIPNIVISSEYIDVDNYPVFSQMQKLVEGEMMQIIKESKY